MPHRPLPGAALPGTLVPGAVLAAGAAMAVMMARFGASPVLPAYCYLAAAGALLAVIDARERRLPDMLTLPSYPAALVLLGLAALAVPGGVGHFRGALLGMAATLAVFGIQALAYPAGLGWGDVKLSGILGLYLGWLGPGALLAGLFLGYLLAAVAGLGLPEVPAAVRPVPAGRDPGRDRPQRPRPRPPLVTAAARTSTRARSGRRPARPGRSRPGRHRPAPPGRAGSGQTPRQPRRRR